MAGNIRLRPPAGSGCDAAAFDFADSLGPAEASLPELVEEAKVAVDRFEFTLQQSLSALQAEVLGEFQKDSGSVKRMFLAFERALQSGGRPRIRDGEPVTASEAGEEETWSCTDEGHPGFVMEVGRTPGLISLPRLPAYRSPQEVARPELPMGVEATVSTLELPKVHYQDALLSHRPADGEKSWSMTELPTVLGKEMAYPQRSAKTEPSTIVVELPKGLGQGTQEDQDQAAEILSPVTPARPSRQGMSFESFEVVDRRLTKMLSNLSQAMSTVFVGRTGSKELSGYVKDTTLACLLRSRAFEGFCSLMILVNCAILGLEAHEEVADSPLPNFELVCSITEHVFTAFFLLECWLRYKAFGLKAFYPPNSLEQRANLVDLALALVTGVLLTWIIPFIVWLVHSESPFLSVFSVLRVIRLTRLVRVFRKVPAFKEAWMLIRGLGNSHRTLFWTVVVVFFVTYGFAIFGVELIVKSLKNLEVELTDGEEIRQIHGLLDVLQGLDKMMFTLVQVLCNDSFHQYIRQLLLFLPWSWTFFYAYIAVVSIVLMNLVTAIIVENAMETSRNDQEHKLQEKTHAEQEELKQLQALFKSMDTDQSGTLTWLEFKESFRDSVVRDKWRLLDFQKDDCRDLFKLLDTGTGEISIPEFFDGLRRMKGFAQAKDIFRLQKTVDKLQDLVRRSSDNLSAAPSRSVRSR